MPLATCEEKDEMGPTDFHQEERKKTSCCVHYLVLLSFMTLMPFSGKVIAALARSKKNKKSKCPFP